MIASDKKKGYWTGKKFTDEHKANIGRAGKGRVPWNKGLKYKGGWKNPISEETKKKMSEALKGKKPWNDGMRGENSHNWKGGKSTLTHRIRTCTQYSEWRYAVYKRDYWTCQECNIKKNPIEAHHIKPLKDILSVIPQDMDINKKYEIALSLEDIFNIDNGVTLCKSCHGLTFKETTNDSI